MLKDRSYGNRKKEYILYFLIMLIKYGYFGYKYYPILDDWIQYGGYPLYNRIFNDVILRIGTYTTRPLAALLDPYLWGSFWPNMGVAFLIITVMYFLSYIFIDNTLKYNGINTTSLLFIVFCLMPLGTEGSYWISASTRIVIGIFFMSLSLFILCKYIANKNKILLFLFILTNLISLCFYEQIIVLSFFCAIIIMFANKNRLNNKMVFIIPFINIGLIGIYYKIFSRIGNMSDRGTIVKGEYFTHLKEAFDKITDVWGQVQIPLLLNGLRRGMEILTSGNSIIYLIIIIVMSLLLAFTYKEEKDISLSKKILLFVTGAILFWVPYLPNILVENIWICNRNVFASFIGLGLIIESVFLLISENKIIYYLKKVIIFIIVLSFLIINISELNDYKSISEIDKEVCTEIINNIDDEDFYNGNKKAAVFNTKDYYVEQNSFFHDHILNVTSSDWALTGGVRAIAQNIKIKYLVPVKNGDNINEELINNYIMLGIDKDFNIQKLNIKEINKKYQELYSEKNEIFGIISNGIFIKAQEGEI